MEATNRGCQSRCWVTSHQPLSCKGKGQTPAGAQVGKKKNHDIFFSQLRIDHVPGPPWEGWLMCTLFLSMHQ